MIEAFERIPVLIVACLVDAPNQHGPIFPAVQDLLLAARVLDTGTALATG